MPKNIVFCADGTWSGDDKDPLDATAPTNVLKLFHDLAGTDTLETFSLSDEQERILHDATGGVTQVAKWIHGVGDSDNWLVKIVGGSIGAGLIKHVVRGYTFVSRWYEPGDRIHLVGFSRGAYTARALAGLIDARGLLDASRLDLDDREGAYRAGASQWTAYRRARLRFDPLAIGKLEELLTLLPGFFDKPHEPAPLRPDVPIEVVAVWDTVGSMGIPVFDGHGANIDALRFTDTRLSEHVKFGIQAIAIDEQRGNFTPCLWQDDPRVTQWLFAGAHTDCGGGNPATAGESGLSDISLAWMIDRLRMHGVLFLSPLAYQPAPDPRAPAHAPWRHAPWRFFPTAIRPCDRDGQFPAGLTLHPSVKQRLAAASVLPDVGGQPAAYAPANLAGYR